MLTLGYWDEVNKKFESNYQQIFMLAVFYILIGVVMHVFFHMTLFGNVQNQVS